MNQLQAFDGYSMVDPVYVDKKLSTLLNIFWLGFTLYATAFSLYATGGHSLYRIEALGLLLMLVGTIGAVQLKIENKYLRVTYILYCLWSLIVIARGFALDYDFLYNSFFDAWYGVLPYFVPIVLLFPKNLVYLRKVFIVIVILALVYLVCLLKYRGQLEDVTDDGKGQDLMEIFSKTLAVPCGFLVITYIYQSNVRRFIAFTAILLTLLLALLRARRGIAFMNVTYLLCFCGMYLIFNRVRFSAIVVALFVVGLVSFGGFTLYQEHKHGAFSLITSRINEDTRSYVEESFYDDLTTTDWIFGKGMSGQYFCPGVDENGDAYTGGYRTVIETGYLNVILKGGIISIALILLIMLPAIIKGFFQSKNLLSKAAATWILLWVVDLYPATVHTFTLNYVLVWLSVGICYSKAIREMPEQVVKEMLSRKVKNFL